VVDRRPSWQRVLPPAEFNAAFALPVQAVQEGKVIPHMPGFHIRSFVSLRADIRRACSASAKHDVGSFSWKTQTRVNPHHEVDWGRRRGPRVTLRHSGYLEIVSTSSLYEWCTRSSMPGRAAPCPSQVVCCTVVRGRAFNERTRIEDRLKRLRIQRNAASRRSLIRGRERTWKSLVRAHGRGFAVGSVLPPSSSRRN